jgi:hypothetical protein
MMIDLESRQSQRRIQRQAFSETTSDSKAAPILRQNPWSSSSPTQSSSRDISLQSVFHSSRLQPDPAHKRSMIVMMKMKCCRTGTLEPSVPSKASTITQRWKLKGKCAREAEN